MKILFFIESLRSGGKERRLVELIHFLNKYTDLELMLVLTERDIHYHYVHNLRVNLKIVRRKWLRKDPSLFYKFFRICNEFKPDIIHTWGSMLSFYALPVIIIKKIPHINSHITDAPVDLKRFGFHHMVVSLGFKFSTIILANSYAGLKSYGVSGDKCRVIYNGVRISRFTDLPDKELIKNKYNIRTSYAVIMVASFTTNKNYDQLVDIAELFSVMRNDITFIGVGDTDRDISEYQKIKLRVKRLNNFILLDKVNDVEALVNACDIGVLFTYSEGISNSIIEYMACGKPAIANDLGGTREIITHNKTGMLLTYETTEEIANLITELIDNKIRRTNIGENARLHIKKHFSIERMGNDFIQLYAEVIDK